MRGPRGTANGAGFEALHQANPRHGPTFEASVDAIGLHTRRALATAALGTSAGALPPTVTRGRSRPAPGVRQWHATVTGAGAVVTAVLFVTSLTTSTPRPNQARTASSERTTRSVPAHGGGSTTATTTPAGSTTTTTGAPVGAAATSDTTAPATTSPVSLSPVALARGSGQPPLTRAPAASPPPTAPPTTGSTVAAARPTCAVSALVAGPRPHQSVRVQDTGSGLASITNVAVTNGTVTVPRFAAGTKAAVIVVAIKTDGAQPTVWSFDATDVAGHTTHCE